MVGIRVAVGLYSARCEDPGKGGKRENRKMSYGKTSWQRCKGGLATEKTAQKSRPTSQ